VAQETGGDGGFESLASIDTLWVCQPFVGFDHRRRPEMLRTAIATAFFWRRLSRVSVSAAA